MDINHFLDNLDPIALARLYRDLMYRAKNDPNNVMILTEMASQVRRAGIRNCGPELFEGYIQDEKSAYDLGFAAGESEGAKNGYDYANGIEW